MNRLIFSQVALGGVLLLALGCSGSDAMPDYGSQEGLKIAQLVSEFNDAKADPRKFKKIFAGTAPATWKEYEKFVYEVEVGSPRIDGANATANVAIHRESDYEILNTKEWTFSKVGDAWKLKSAPLR